MTVSARLRYSPLKPKMDFDMKKVLLLLPLCLSIQACSMVPTEGLDLVSTPERTASTVIGAALGGYLGAKLGDDVGDSSGETVGLLGGTYLGMLAPAMIWKNYGTNNTTGRTAGRAGSQLYSQSTTTVRRGTR